MLLAYG
jgi:hypothetical protein